MVGLFSLYIIICFGRNRGNRSKMQRVSATTSFAKFIARILGRVRYRAMIAKRMPDRIIIQAALR